MFETTKVILKDNTRSLVKKIKESPFLYVMFTGMILFSIIIFAYATFFLLHVKTNLHVTLGDVFSSVFFIFFLKSAADFHNAFIKSSEVTYALSTQVNQKKTALEIFFSVLATELIIWFSFSIMFIVALYEFRIDVGYPIEYIVFTLGVITSACIGCAVSISIFSPKRYRLVPMFILLGVYFYANNPLFIVFNLPLAAIQCAWSLNHSMESYLFTRRKERTKEKAQVKMRSFVKAQFYRETTVLWRDKLLFSFIFTSITTALFSGYLFLHGDEILIPGPFRETLSGFLPSMFLFLGVYVVIMYTSVFPALNLFLNEEKTMWIIRHMPVKNETIIYGKVSALSLCFITAIPFIPYMLIFTGFDQFVYLVWFLIFSFIAGIIVSVPLGVKYVGKKSDILLLYSVAMILFLLLGLMSILTNLVQNIFNYPIIFYTLALMAEILVLYVSLKLSSEILSLRK